jgi:GTP-binding protein
MKYLAIGLIDTKMEIKKAAFVKSSAQVKDCPDPDRPEYAFIGRSNVGKSSLINMLCGRKELAKISGKPGKTQLINHFDIDGNWYLVDLPGYGYAKVSQKDREKFNRMIRQYIRQRPNLVNLYILVDGRHDAQKIDLEFMRWVGENGIPFTIIFTKLDKISSAAFNKQFIGYKKKMAEDWEYLPPIHKSSSRSALGKTEILQEIGRLNEELKDQFSV